MHPNSPPILDLHGIPPAALHRPRLASLACLLFAIAAIVGILTAAISFAFVFPIASIETWVMFWRINAACVGTSTSLLVAAAIVLNIADIARHASPRLSPWPRRLILLLVVLYAAGHCIYVFGMFSLDSSGYVIHYRSFYLPVFVVALGAAAGAYTVGFIYALQIAAFLRDRTFRIASTTILCPVLLIITSELFFTANDLAKLHGVGLHLPEFPLLDICWGIIGAAMAIALTVFFFLLAHRLRRAAANSEPLH
ncbi:MAG: hypothetical protein FWD61_05215 [Phycisphaerales bacterium]|nr:hypothetical protein [Phycisphaerales bacterium]